MTYCEAYRLLEEGKRSSIYRKSWQKVDSSACLSWAADSRGQPFLHFSACGDWLYKEGGWGGTQEDRDATDWAGTMPEVTKTEAVRQAMVAGIEGDEEGAEWILNEFGREIMPTEFASMKRKIERE